MSEQNGSTTVLRTHRRRGQRLTAEERKVAQKKFIDSFKLNANITVACLQAGVDRSQIYRWQEHDEQFAHEFQQAELAANDMLLAAAWQRAVKGVEKYVVSMGQQVYVDGKPLIERVYSDSVLLRLMSWRIAGFKETNPGTTINNVNLSMQRNEVYAHMRDDELDQLEALWQNAQERLQRGSSE